MQVILLYVTVVLIWGSTWFTIPFQLGDVAAELSVAYRYAIASLVLYGYAHLFGQRLRLPRSAYPMVLAQGALLFSINYLFVYYGIEYITSGLVAVLFSSIVICNAAFERLFFKTLIDNRLLIAAAVGLSGITMIFWPEVEAISIEDDTVVGIGFMIGSVVIASLGNMTAVVNNTRRALPIVAVNAHAMAFAALLSFVIAALLGREIRFSLEPGYLISLAYLAIFGSAIAFGCYLALLKRIGPARAAYSSVLYPVVALAMSTFFEGYRWTTIAAVGIMLTLGGNWLILSGRTKTTKNTKGTNQ